MTDGTTYTFVVAINSDGSGSFAADSKNGTDVAVIGNALSINNGSYTIKFVADNKTISSISLVTISPPVDVDGTTKNVTVNFPPAWNFSITGVSQSDPTKSRTWDPKIYNDGQPAP